MSIVKCIKDSNFTDIKPDADGVIKFLQTRINDIQKRAKTVGIIINATDIAPLQEKLKELQSTPVSQDNALQSAVVESLKSNKSFAQEPKKLVFAKTTKENYKTLENWSSPELFLKNLSKSSVQEFLSDKIDVNKDLVTTLYNIIAYQTASVDNANKNLLGKGNINAATFKFVMPALLQGLDMKTIQSVLQAPIIKEYISTINSKQSIGSSFTPELKSKVIFDIASDKMKILYPESSKADLDEIVGLYIADRETLTWSERYNIKIKPKPSIYEEIDLLLAYDDYTKSHSELSTLLSLTNIDSAGAGKSILDMTNKLKDIDSLLDSSRYDVEEMFTPSDNNLLANIVNNLRDVVDIFTTNDVTVSGRLDGIYDNLYKEFHSTFAEFLDLNNSFVNDNVTSKLEKFISAYLWNKALALKTGESADFLRYSLLEDNPLQKSLGTIIQEINNRNYHDIEYADFGVSEKDTIRNKNLNQLLNTTFFKSLNVQTPTKDYPNLKFVTRNNQDQGNYDPNLIHNEIAQLYESQSKFVIGRINGKNYTTRDLINDITTYALAVGATQSTNSLLNIVPSDILLDFKSNIDQITLSNTKTDNIESEILLEFILNNPEVLPTAPSTVKFGAETFKVTVDNNKGHYVAKGDDVYKVIQTGENYITYGLMNPLKYKNYLKSYLVSHEKNAPRTLLNANALGGNAPVRTLNKLPVGYDVQEKTGMPGFTTSGGGLAWVYDLSNNNIHKDVAAALLQQYGDIPIVMMSPEQLGNEAALGRYYRKENVIGLSNTASKAKLAKTVLHEVGHAATLNKIYQYDKYRIDNNKSSISGLSKAELNTINIDTLTQEQISILDNLAKAYDTISAVSPELQASKNLAEFVSEMISSPLTRKTIDKIAAEDNNLVNVVDNIYKSIVNLFRTILNLFTNKKPSKDYSASDKIIAGILFLAKTNNLTYRNLESGNVYNFTLVDNSVVNGVIQYKEDPNAEEKALANPRKAYEEIQLDIAANAGKYNVIESKTNIEQTRAITENFETIQGYNSMTSAVYLTEEQHNTIMKPLTDGDIEALDSNFAQLVNVINNRYNVLVRKEARLQSELKNKDYSAQRIKEINKAIAKVDKQILDNANNLKAAIEAKKLSDILNLATTQGEEILKLLDRGDYIPSPEQINYINDIVNNYHEFFERNGDNSFIDNTQYYNLNDASKIEFNQKLNDVKTLFEQDITTKINEATDNWIKETVRREKGGKVYINVDEVLDDIGLLGEWTLSIDRTNEDLLSMIGLLKQKTVFQKDTLIRNKNKTLRELFLKALPKLSPKDSKFSYYTLFINDDGSLVLDIDSKFHKEQTSHKEKISRLLKYEEEGRDVAARLKKARKDYSDFRKKVYINLNPRYIVPRPGSKIPQATIDKEIQKYIDTLGNDVYQYKAQQLRDKIKMYDRDYEAYKLQLEESVLRVDGKIINPKDEQEINRKLSNFYKLYSPYGIEDARDNDGSVMIDGERTYPKYKYAVNAVKRFDNGKETGYYNPKMVEIRKDQDLLNFHTEIVKTFAEVRDMQPGYMKGNIRLSDIPYFEREFMTGLVQDIKDSPTDTIRRARLKLVDYFVERIPQEAKSLPSNRVRTANTRETAANINEITNQRLISEYSKRGISPDKVDKSSTEYLATKYRIRQEVQEELSKFKSYDLLTIANLYYAASITSKVKADSINELALLRERATKKFGSRFKGSNKYIGDVKQSKNTTAPRKDNLLDKDYSAWQGLSPRNPLAKISKKKQYNELEHVQKKYLEEAIADLEKVKLDDTNRESITKTLNKYRENLDRLGGYMYWGNVARVFNNITTYSILGYNISSFIPNKMIGLFNNIIEANDGRVFSKDTFNKIAKEIYFKSEITQFSAGVGGALLANILLPGSGIPLTLLKLLGGYGIIGGAARKMIKPSPIASKLVKFMVENDILQKSQDEMRRSSSSIARNTSKQNFINKLGLGSTFNDAIEDPFIFTTKSEIPHQASMMGAVLEDFKFTLDGNETSLLSQINEEGVLSNPNKLVNHPKIKNRKVTLSELLNEAVATGTALISRNHGNYRQDFKQLLKYSDAGTLAATFKTWMFESYASRLEEEKTDWLIQDKKGTTHQVKGSYRSIIENSGSGGAVVALAGRSMTRGAVNATIGMAFGGPIGSLVGIGLTGIATVASYSYLKKSGIVSGTTQGVNKTALELYLAQLANVGTLGKYAEGRRKRAGDKLEEILSPIDAANYRRVITERVLGTYLFAMYSAIVIAQNLHDDDDEAELDAADRMLYFAMNTTGRMMLDIDAYSSPGDAYSKVERLDRVFPSVNNLNNMYKFTDAFFHMDRYERKEGRYDKGDYKFKKYLKDIVPWVRPTEGVQKVTEQAYQIFNNK